uniref:hypothetical protein n=1 Tax=Staphylococcus warneri TaxID=1292 RepID=UPI001643A5AC
DVDLNKGREEEINQGVLEGGLSEMGKKEKSRERLARGGKSRRFMGGMGRGRMLGGGVRWGDEDGEKSLRT